MSEEILKESGPEVLGRLLRLGTRSYSVCDDRELAELLVHHLDAPTEFEPTGDWIAMPPAGLRRSIGQVLFDPASPLALLEQVKRYAKAHRNHPASPLPIQVATVLYLGGVSAALCRGGQISELDDRALREALDWAIHQAWLEPALRELLRRGLRHLPEEGAL